MSGSDFGPAGAALGFPYTPSQGGGGGAVALAGDVTGTTAASVVSELQGVVLDLTAPVDGGSLVYDAGTNAITARGPALPDPTGAPDGQVPTTTGGVYGLAARGIDTSLQSAPDTGWTAAGVGPAAIASGVVTLTMGAAEADARLQRAAPTSPHSPALEVSARVTRTASPGSDYNWFGISLASSDAATGYLLFAGSDATAYAVSDASTIGTAALPATITSGQLWLRIVATPYMVAWYVGAGASRPTTWTRVAVLAAPLATVADARLTHLAARAGRATGTGTAEGQVADIQWRSLLGAPT